LDLDFEKIFGDNVEKNDADGVYKVVKKYFIDRLAAE